MLQTYKRLDILTLWLHANVKKQGKKTENKNATIPNKKYRETKQNEIIYISMHNMNRPYTNMQTDALTRSSSFKHRCKIVHHKNKINVKNKFFYEKMVNKTLFAELFSPANTTNKTTLNGHGSAVNVQLKL